MAERNGNLKKIGAWGAVATLIVSIFVIFGFAGGIIDGKIDNRILEYDSGQKESISDIKRDVAVIQERQKQIQEDIGEIKELLRDSQ